MGKSRALVALAFFFLASACADEPAENTPPAQRVLFVGNSLLYYNDLPSLFAAWAQSQPGDALYSTELIAEAGYSLAQHLENRVLESELESGDYDLVILQEIGGWPLCASSNLECADLESRLERISDLARQHGADALWMATWHPVPGAQAQLSELVAAVSERTGIRVVDTGRALHTSSEFDAFSELLAPDLHPDPAGSSYLAALLLAAAEDEPLSAPSSPLAACTRDWRNTGIVATNVASAQEMGEPQCDALSEDLAARIVRDVNAAMGFPK